MKHTVAVTGGTRGVGKSATAATLAIVYADAGADVVLVDCDSVDPSLAADLGITKPDASIRDVVAGRATLREAIHSGPAGVAVVPGAQFDAPGPDAISGLIQTVTGFGVVVCDTGHPFADATQGAIDAADGVLVASAPDETARQNTAILHESLQEGKRAPLLGTVLTRVGDASANQSWDCEVLASIPDSEAIASNAGFVLDAPTDPASVAYRELANDVIDRLRAGPESIASKQGLWLPPPADPFFTPDATMFGTADSGEIDTTAESTLSTDRDETGDTSTDPDTNALREDSSDAAEAAAADTKDQGGVVLTRRGVLAAITAAVGGVSAGILDSSETIDIEAFGYGGRPVTSNTSSTENTTSNTSSTGSLPMGRLNRSAPTNETGSDDSTQDLLENDTDTEGVDNTTDPENTSNTTETDEQVDSNTDSEDEDSKQDAEDSETDTNGEDGDDTTDNSSDTGDRSSESTEDGETDASGEDSNQDTEDSETDTSGDDSDQDTEDGETDTSGEDGDDTTDDSSGSSEETEDSETDADEEDSDQDTEDSETDTSGDDSDQNTEDGETDTESEQFGTFGYGQGGYGGVA